MTKKDLIAKLNEFRNLPAETEWLEFKEAVNNFEVEKLGKYFSALSNEANLKSLDFGWLVFGLKDDKSIVGTNFRRDKKHLDKLKGEISEHTTYRISFAAIHELNLSEGRVLMFQIPAALRGIPTEWKGHFYGRDGENLVPLSEEKKERIRKQNFEEDWSKVICSDATIEDLDEEAIVVGRKNYKSRYPEKAAEMDAWDDITFLNKAKITIKNKITRTAIILLGKNESEHFVSPADIKIRWLLKDSKGNNRDLAIEGCPFILAIDRIYARIRNFRYQYFKDTTLFPEEIDQYEPFTIREAINNCIAHQDYNLGGRINVVEMDDELMFTNKGIFIPGSVEKVVIENAPEEKYRNKFLSEAMFNLKMVETAGGGIRRMFNEQARRFFPLPDYEFPNNRVQVKIIGKVLDMDYAEVLAQDKDLTLEEIIMLDKVQKKKPLFSHEAKHLKSKRLIEGIKPNYFISAKVAQKIGQKAEYTKARGFDKEKYFELIINCIRQHGNVERKDINDLLSDVLPSWMSEKQKYTKISHLLAELRRKNKIQNIGSDFKSRWIILKRPSKL